MRNAEIKTTAENDTDDKILIVCISFSFVYVYLIDFSKQPGTQLGT
jgi:hypothetical protein